MATARTQDLGNGFRFHGIATPVSNHRGTVATVDGAGRNVVLVWLFDHRGGYALLVIDALTGATQEIAMPFAYGGDCPYASILSSKNRFYTHFASHFVEFDPSTRELTFVKQTTPQMAMSMTEDDRGRIWSATYPSSGVACFDPARRELRDYGHVYKQGWPQYQRSMAADDAGWVYFAVGYTSSQIVALDPASGTASPILAEGERVQGGAFVERDRDGKVYGLRNEKSAGEAGAEWIELYRGRAGRPAARASRRAVPYVTGSQSLFHREFPDGSRLEECDLTERRLRVAPPRGGPARELSFDYSSDGAHVMGLAAAPDRTIAGGTAFPMRFFSFDPAADRWVNRECFGQWNTVATQGDRFFVGAYSGGFLLEWDPSRPWIPTEKGDAGGNPAYHLDCEPDINRPHALLAHPDGRTVVMAGTPGYGYTGGGLLFWDRGTSTSVLRGHTELLPEHSTMSLVALDGGKLLGGSTTAAGTGGAKKASEAELYQLDLGTKRIEWHEAVFPGVQGYTALHALPGGLVLGFADRTRFFVFDPGARRVVHEQDTTPGAGECVSHQGPRVFVRSDDGAVFALFTKGIAKIEMGTWRITMVAESPVPIQAGGDVLDGRVYFASGSHVYSWGIGDR
jgi:hypothetical protein